MAEKTKEFVARKRDTGVSRREFMGTTVIAVAAGSMAASFPFIAKAADPLRTIGLGVSVINEIQGKAAEDLGYGVTGQADRKSTRLNSSHALISYAVFCLKKKTKNKPTKKKTNNINTQRLEHDHHS